VLSTQRPSTNIINGMIKANFPARISCKVSSHIDSKIILDSSGAENLMGKGDAIIKDNFRNLERFQVAYVSPKQFIN
jgi:S-DNA-T family DNA segregation ATPase FtsK/SpoIIIE